ncbi:MAG: hypothetical protein IPG02_19670 [Ignavibacteria bacterium]|nr:hypothetical protein [Ignavibacteria bacterium]MBK6876107.1 hypothetical protein [Ignavibacteria bacterium]MBK9226906.1 hypothetical protein [Ignavibacteria bacterium]
MNLIKYFSAFTLILVSFSFYSCDSNCSNGGKPDLKLTSQNFPSSAQVDQNIQLTFTVANNSTDECTADNTTDCQVNLKLVKRETQQVQVNNFDNLDALADKQTKLFTFNVVIGPNPGPGTYDLTFTIDPDNRSNDAVRENNVFTSVIIVN